MFHIHKRVLILKSREEEVVKEAEKILTAAGLDVKSWASDPVPVAGCGAHIRPSDWSGKKTPPGVVKGMVYHLSVYEEDEEKARKLLEKNLKS
ncbi:MAG: hypothetical protein PUG16_07220 [Lachnospiraceae bacterium]|jgi:hypothetical protein|nr:hypothetical protein [Lachnospiraceae bacterium]